MRKIKLFLALVIFSVLIFSGLDLHAQCFASPGNPVAGSANIGVLQQRISRMVVFHKFSYSDTYYAGSNKVDYNFPTAIENANYNYSGISFGYGLKPKLTLEVEAGYFFNKTQNYRYIDYKLRGFGLSNAVFSAKYNIHKNVDKKTEITVAGGVKVPFRLKPQVVDGVRLDIDVQPSTGNFGFNLQALFVKEFKNISARIIFLSRYDK
jgi:hypothetical protein